MHHPLPEDIDALADIGCWAIDRLTCRSETLPPREPTTALPEFTADGIGTAGAWSLLRDVILPSALPTDHSRYLAFVGGAPTVASVLADMAISAAAVYAGSALEGGAVVDAERAALRWLADVVGLPVSAHGTFVSGGSLANLSALVAARHDRTGPDSSVPSIIIAGATAHASVHSAAMIMGCQLVVAGSPDRPLTADDVRRALDPLDRDQVVAVVACAGATNTGAIDRLDEIAQLCATSGVWLHVDAAYGGAAMLSASARDKFRGIEFADSVTIDPHKWLFTPFDCAAVLYRDPERARSAHRQSAHYLDPANVENADNPADYAVHLTRRARGIPLWASLVANGTAAYCDAVERCLEIATYAAKQIEECDVLELVTEPELSVILFRRVGWAPQDYSNWSSHAVRTGLGLITPTKFKDETVLRMCFVNPLTQASDVDLIMDSLSQATIGVPRLPRTGSQRDE